MYKMRIGIDIRCLQTPSSTRGIGSYVHNLVSNILSIDKSNEYLLFALKGKELTFKFPGGASNIHYISKPAPYQHLGWIKDNFTVNKALEKHNLDIFYFTSPFETSIGFNLRQKTKFKKIATVYDLTPLYFKDLIFSGKWYRKYLKFSYFYLLNSITRADKIIAISQNTARDLSKELNINKEKIDIIYCGADKKFFSSKDKFQIESVRKKYGIPSDFLLYVGAVSPTKNIKFLIDIIRKINLPLVIAGHRTNKDKKFLSDSVTGLENLVYFLDFVPAQDLPSLYGAAKIFVFPSLYEGFGMPPLEAMACGVPVISSNTSSMPEVIGGAGILIDPDDEKTWIKEISNLWGDQNLRGKLSQKGTEQAKKFSWEESAAKIVEIFNNANRN